MKELLTESSFRKTIEKKPVGAYLFFGDEDYLKMHALKTTREIVCPDPTLAVFNEINIDCSTSDDFTDALAGSIAAYPMMADSKLIIMTGLRICEMKADEIDALLDVVDTIGEYDFNLLIICVPSGAMDEGRLPKRPSSILAKLSNHLDPVYFPRVAPQKLSSWMVRHFEHNGVRAENGVAAAILKRCGDDMFALSNEVDKLSFYALSKGRDTVTLADVPHVTCPNDEYDNFELGSAIAAGNSVRALEILAIMKLRKIEPVIIMGELSKTLGDMLAIKLLLNARKTAAEIVPIMKLRSEAQARVIMNQARDFSLDYLKRAVKLCAEADASLKLSSYGYIDIERLICSL